MGAKGVQPLATVAAACSGFFWFYLSRLHGLTTIPSAAGMDKPGAWAPCLARIDSRVLSSSCLNINHNLSGIDEGRVTSNLRHIDSRTKRLATTAVSIFLLGPQMALASVGSKELCIAHWEWKADWASSGAQVTFSRDADSGTACHPPTSRSTHTSA